MKRFSILGNMFFLVILLSNCTDNKKQDSNSKPQTSEELTDVEIKSFTPTTKKVGFTIYKSPTCGCCALWVEHMENAGFQALVEHPEDLDAIKNQYHIAPQYQSCHTAVYRSGDQEYIFEGHIPVKFIQKFLENPPAGAIGLSVPGMPLGSPGMEVNERFTPYAIYQLNTIGEPSLFAEVSTMQEQYNAQ